MRSRTKPADERRADFLEAGQAVFAGKGLQAATVDDITAAAGVAKGTFYLYFSSKYDLLAALQQRFVDGLTAQQQAACGRLGADDWWGRLDTWVASGIAEYLDNHETHDVLFRHDTVLGSEHTKAAGAGPVVDSLAELLRRGAAAGVFAVDDPPMMAFLLYGLFHWAGDHVIHHQRDAAEVRRVVTLTQEMFRRATTVRH